MPTVSHSLELASIAEREAMLLAPAAFHSRETKGRKFPEPEQDYRGPFQRDRDRIVHSSAFRRLSGKMQVFTGDMGDYHRTRLTHTHEVASIARTIARALRLNEDLVEALALFHDIGHPPFGHAGEDAIHECLRSCGGFSHNQHALTIAEELEQQYPQFPGLNLSIETLESQRTRIHHDPTFWPLLEAQVVEIADGATYNAHDTDDAVKLGLVTLDELAETAMVKNALGFVRRQVVNPGAKALRRSVVRELLDRQVRDVLQFSLARLRSFEGGSWLDARDADLRLSLSPEVTEMKRELGAFLYERVYRHPTLLRMRDRAKSRVHEVFSYYTRNPEKMPELYYERARRIGTERAVGDYLAGMTDRFLDRQHESLPDPKR